RRALGVLGHMWFLFLQAEDGIRARNVTGVQTCALPFLASESTMRSCGRFGPAIEGTTVDRSSSRYSEYWASCDGSCHRPWRLARSEERRGGEEYGDRVGDGRAQVMQAREIGKGSVAERL